MRGPAYNLAVACLEAYRKNHSFYDIRKPFGGTRVPTKAVKDHVRVRDKELLNDTLWYVGELSAKDQRRDVENALDEIYVLAAGDLNATTELRDVWTRFDWPNAKKLPSSDLVRYYGQGLVDVFEYILDEAYDLALDG